MSDERWVFEDLGVRTGERVWLDAKTTDPDAYEEMRQWLLDSDPNDEIGVTIGVMSETVLTMGSVRENVQELLDRNAEESEKLFHLRISCDTHRAYVMFKLRWL